MERHGQERDFRFIILDGQKIEGKTFSSLHITAVISEAAYVLSTFELTYWIVGFFCNSRSNQQ